MCNVENDLDLDPDLDLNKGTYTNQPFGQFNFGYSVKNIPLCSEKQYIKALINKTENFVQNLRWRTFFFLLPDLENSTKETYGFNSTKSPPFIPELKEFENGLALLIENIKFRKFDNEFQKVLRSDLIKIKREKKLLIPADKTSNYYKLSSEQYESLITKGIQKEYKKTNEKIVWQINAEDKQIAEKLELSDRIDVTAKREAFITLEDHKENFRNKPTCRLINPCKPE